jgi:hypothetical protein
MRTTLFATAAMCIFAAVFTAPASAGLHVNGPALDGHKVALPRGSTQAR